MNHCRADVNLMIAAMAELAMAVRRHGSHSHVATQLAIGN